MIKNIDLSKVIIVDNQLLSFALQPDNGIPISSYYYDPTDTELKCVADYLQEKILLLSDDSIITKQGCDDWFGVEDVREVNRQQFKLQNIIDHALKAYNMTNQGDSTSPHRDSNYSSGQKNNLVADDGDSEQSSQILQQYQLLLD